MRATKVRIVCTNDFLGSFSPMATSYGRLPGAAALQETVERLRDGQPTIWADAGDFSQGGALSTATGGVTNFTAAGSLGIDVATVGNHEFDWGLPHLAEHREQLPFPLICANVDLGLPGSTLVATEHGPVGFVGLTHPQVNAFTPFAPAPAPDTAGIVIEQAGELRQQGAIAVVVLIHFGVDWSVSADGEHRPDPEPVLNLLGPCQDAVDAIVLGHTLGRWVDVIDGVPFAQPWAFGAEVGVIDLDLDTGRHRAELVTVEGEPRPWPGSGRTAIEAAERTIVGHLDKPLAIDFAGDVSLADFAAESLRRASGATGAVVPVVGMHQPAIGGVMYRWPAGPVTEADISRLVPWTDDRSLIAELSTEELDAVMAFVAPEPWLGWGTATGGPEGPTTTLAIPRDYVDWGAIQVEQIIGRQLALRPVEVRLRDALRTELA